MTTGERLTLGELGPILEKEHLARYVFAETLIAGKMVADIACGTGYGTTMLARRGALSVHGMDLSKEAVAYCTDHNSAPNVTYSVANAEAVTAVPSNSFDIIISFETIEHLQNVEAYLREMARLLRPDGTFLVSTPDRRIASVMHCFQGHPTNRYHTREYTDHDLLPLLAKRFDIEICYGQAFLPRWLVFWPIQFAIKSLCRALGTVAARRFKDSLYSNGAHVEVIPKGSTSRIPRFWVISCTNPRK
jgi:ubiquinone/menaquinone biosynthesis C-methylase UbiE